MTEHIIKIDAQYRHILDQPAIAAREQRIAQDRAVRPQAVEPLYAGGYYGPGAPSQEEINSMKADEVMRKQKIATMNEELLVRRQLQSSAQTEARNNQMLANSMLGLNMSLLGISFTYQNVSRMMNAQKEEELALLQLKDKKSKADKERIKQLQKEQIEQQKLNTYITGAISLTQMLMSVMQIALVIRQMNANATMRQASTSLVNAQAQRTEGAATSINAGQQSILTIAKAGWLAPVMAALLIASMIPVLGLIFMNIRGKGAAKGADIMPSNGGSLVTVGEGGQRELISPVPMLERIVTDRTRDVIRSEGGGGKTIIIYANDAMSFAENNWITEETLRKRGVK